MDDLRTGIIMLVICVAALTITGNMWVHASQSDKQINEILPYPSAPSAATVVLRFVFILMAVVTVACMIHVAGLWFALPKGLP
jgi:hypothetical protein